MKTSIKIIALIIIGLITFEVQAQVNSGFSASKKIKAGKRQVVTRTMKAVPDLIIKEELFIDPNGNNVINGNERSSIKFKVENLGSGIAKKVSIKVSLKNRQIRGLDFFSSQEIGDIQPNESKDVNVPLFGNMELEDAIAEFKIEVIEDQSFDAFPLEMKIETHPFEPPKLVVADAVFSTESGGKVKLNYPIQLKVLLQNVGKGEASGVSLSFTFPNPNCVVLGESDKFNIGYLKPNETKELDFIFTANRRYTDPEIPVRVDIIEMIGKYSNDTTLNVRLDQSLVAQNNVVINAIATPVTEVTMASLTSDVDKNIPVSQGKDPNKFALIIGNEEYSKYQQGLNTEMNVAFARNDASIFRDYCIRTLGFQEGNVFFLTDATTGEMNQKIELISKLVDKSGKDAELLFYYAGHGLPDENTHIPYLIPVDVNGSNLISAIPLNDVYKKFGATGAKKITVFLDACFSGGGRESGLIAARSVKVKPSMESLSGNMVVFAATTGEQSALPFSKEKHGMFTYYLLKKMQESSGNVTFGALADYITKNVSLQSLKVNEKDQDPTVIVSPEVSDSWGNWKIK